MPLPALSGLTPVTVNDALPVFVIVSTLVAVEPAATSPNARLPLSPITRVVDGGVGVGVVVEDDDPPQVETQMPRNESREDTFHENLLREWMSRVTGRASVPNQPFSGQRDG